MMRITPGIALLLLVSLGANASQALLEQFFVEVKTLEASFEQKVVDENGMLLDFSKGRLTLSRPGKFRWDYSKTDSNADSSTDLSTAAAQQRGQQIVADGESILMYDPDLEQITKRSLQDAIGQVPSLLLVQNATDIKQHFQVIDIGLTDGLSWVSLKPLDEDAGYQNLMIGFLGEQLSVIVLLDGLGNETRLSLSNVVSNSVLPENSFNLKVPEGVDILSE